MDFGILGLLCLIIYCCFYLKDRFYFRGPWPYPIVGNLPQLGRHMHINMSKISKNYGSIFWVQIFHKPAVVINGSSALTEALLKKAVIFAGRPKMNSSKLICKGHSIAFETYSDIWKVQRKFTMQAIYLFNCECKDSLISAIISRGNEMVHSFKSSHSIEPNSHVTHVITNIMFDILYGDTATLKRRTVIQDAMRHLLAAQPQVILSDMLPWAEKILFGHTMREVHKYTKIVDEVFGDMIKEQELQFQQNKVNSIADAFIKVSSRAGKYGLPQDFDSSILFDSIPELLGAALDTTVSSLLYAIRYMAKYPLVQERLYREFNNSDLSKQTLERKSKAPYLLATLSEISRHSSSLPLALPHATTQDVTLRGQLIPKDTMVFVNLYSANRDGLSWGSDSDVFNPDRFIMKDGSFNTDLSRNIRAFGIGPRRCMGQDIAVKVIAYLFILIVQQYDIKEDISHPISTEDVSRLSTLPVQYRVHFKPRSIIL